MLAILSCTTEGSSEDHVEKIMNGSTSDTLTTFWKSQGNIGVASEGGSCFGPFLLALAEDGTAEWRAEDKDHVVGT